MVVSLNRGNPPCRPQYTIVLIMGTPSLNSLKAGYMGDYIWDYYREYLGGILGV